MHAGIFFSLVAVSGPAAATYPTGEVLTAFASVCADTSSIKAVEASAAKEGWEKFDPAEESRLGKLMAFGKEAAAEIGVPDYDEAVFRRFVAGRPLELAATQVGSTTGCRVYDFEAPAPLKAESLESWAKRAPSDKIDKPEVITSTTWEPGVTGNADKTQIAFFPAGSPLSAMHLSGLALMAQSTGEAK